MFKTSSPQSDVNGLLDRGSHIQGELRFENEFRIRGGLTGSIVSEGELLVGEEGEIEGDIQVRRIVVSGTIKGTLRATESIQITSTGKVFADLFTPSLTVEDGAFLEGRCSMTKAGEKTEPTTPKKVTPISQRR